MSRIVTSCCACRGPESGADAKANLMDGLPAAFPEAPAPPAASSSASVFPGSSPSSSQVYMLSVPNLASLLMNFKAPACYKLVLFTCTIAFQPSVCQPHWLSCCCQFSSFVDNSAFPVRPKGGQQALQHVWLVPPWKEILTFAALTFAMCALGHSHNSPRTSCKHCSCSVLEGEQK